MNKVVLGKFVKIVVNEDKIICCQGEALRENITCIKVFKM